MEDDDGKRDNNKRKLNYLVLKNLKIANRTNNY